MKIISFWVILLLGLTALSCDSDGEEIEFPPLSQGEIWDCYQKREWNEQTIKDELIGQWRWIYSVSYWAPDDGRNTESENTLIRFSGDSTLNVVIDGSSQSSIRWSVVQRDGDLFGVDTENTVAQLYGRILLCDNLLEFNNSYIDGSDNYFERE